MIDVGISWHWDVRGRRRSFGMSAVGNCRCFICWQR